MKISIESLLNLLLIFLSIVKILKIVLYLNHTQHKPRLGVKYNSLYIYVYL